MKKVLAFVMAAMMAFSLTACGGSSAPASAPAAAPAETQATAAEEGGDYVIGFSVLATTAEFLVAMVDGAVEQGNSMGAEVVVKDCNLDAQKQNEQLEDLISQGVSAIVVEPLDSDAIVSAIDKANQAGIPVFTCDTTSNGGEVVAYVASDNLEMGRMGARYIAEEMKARYGDYKGTVVNLMASLTSSNGTARSQGFHEVMDQYPDITIIEQNGDLDVETAMNTMTDILQANDKIDAVWCSGDNNAIGTIQAIKQAQRFAEIGSADRIIVVSGDGGSEILDALRKGTCDACVSQQPITMGKKSVEAAVNYVMNGTAPESEVINVDLYTLTADNLDSEEVAAFGLWADMVE